jgi:hypothetical protein
MGVKREDRVMRGLSIILTALRDDCQVRNAERS